MLVSGGRDENNNDLKTTEIYDISSESWGDGPNLPTTIYESSIVSSSLTSTYAAYILGGMSEGQLSSSIYAITKDLRSWRNIGSFTMNRHLAVILRLPEKITKEC